METAGRGIIHGENVAARGEVRLLQLWLTLPRRERWTAPAFRDIHADAIPVRRGKGVEVRIYSGASGALRSSTPNQVPVTLVEITMAPHAEIEQEIPLSYNGFVYVLRGSVRAGEDATLLADDNSSRQPVEKLRYDTCVDEFVVVRERSRGRGGEMLSDNSMRGMPEVRLQRT